MTDELAPARKIRGVSTSMRLNLFNLVTFENSLSVSLLGIVAALGGATAIVYVATRFGSHNRREVEPVQPADAIEATGVSLVK